METLLPRKRDARDLHAPYLQSSPCRSSLSPRPHHSTTQHEPPNSKQTVEEVYTISWVLVYSTISS